ncbi:hypothetical protein QBC39DRAFT_352826 [Podospora conica]|nr:hypothetical protein QBC39DRAFT_352826 [Schizothecium conicum]
MTLLLPRQTNPHGSFTHPSNPRKSFALGSTQNITYSTNLSSYTIALWQEGPNGGTAELGPIVVYKLEKSPVQTSFLWEVQLYNFKLAKSDVFFFWLHNGTDAALQGVLPAATIPSSYFEINEGDSVTTTTNDASKSTSTTPPSASNTDGGAGTPLTTGGAVTAESGGGGGGGTNVVAVGVGVGVGVLVLVGLIALAIMWWLWKKTTVLDGIKKRVGSGKGDGSAEMGPNANKMFQYPSAGYPSAGYNELDQNRYAELSVAPVAAEMGAATNRPNDTRAGWPRAGWPRAELS